MQEQSNENLFLAGRCPEEKYWWKWKERRQAAVGKEHGQRQEAPGAQSAREWSSAESGRVHRWDPETPRN